MKEKVDLIVNGNIFTIDSDFTIAESFAVSNGKILNVGSFDEINKRYKARQVVDAKGKYIYPGFIDAHCHFNGYGINRIQFANLAGTRSINEIIERIKEHYDKTKSVWILGRGWDQNDWEKKDFPSKEHLDGEFPDIPVCLIRIDGHAAWCNSKALEIAGVDENYFNEGGEVLVNNGAPTGMLIDNAVGLVRRFFPELTEKQKKDALLLAQKDCFAAGLTSVTDCGESKETILRMDSLQKSDELKMRINAMVKPSEENLEYFVKKGEYKTERLHVNAIKLFSDGALGSRGAWLLEDYSDEPGNRGVRVSDEDFLNKICQLAYENNYQVATHCIGDAANRYILNKYGEFLQGDNDRRWRIEHAQIIHPDDFELFKKYSVVPSIQATHATSDMYWADERLGNERVKRAYAYQQLLQQNGWLANGTDFPVEEIYPLNTFYAAVFRMDHEGNPVGGFQMENALTHEQALRSMTIWAAKASFEENEKGSLEPGKWADFVILDTDLMTAIPEQVLNTKVLSTWSAGEKIYGN